MSINLLDTIQSNLHYQPLQKIDPNTEEVVIDNKTPDEQRFSQAAIPALLTGLYEYATTDEGALKILRGDISTEWVNLFFDETTDDVIQKVASYSFVSIDDTRKRMEDIAREAVRLIREQLKPEATMRDVKDFMSNQRNNIVLYLPVSLHMGSLLDDNTLDDNTNKMEGPISSLMHKIGSAFSNPENEAAIKK